MRSNVRFARQERSLDILSHPGRSVRQLRMLLPSSSFFRSLSVAQKIKRGSVGRQKRSADPPST
jgi:hypothetical protein